MKRVLLRFCDAVFLTRPVILIPVWAYFILGFYRSNAVYFPDSIYTLPVFGFRINVLTGLYNIQNYINLLMLTLSVAATYVLNQLVDIETDKRNGGLPLLAKAGISIRMAIIENIILTIIPLGYAIWIRGTVGLLLFLAFALNILYNLRPFYFTGRPFLDFISNAMGFGFIAFGIGFASACNGNITEVSRYFVEATPYFFLMVAGSINSTIPDMEGDRRTGKKTTVVLLGTRRSNLISTAAIITAFIMAAFNRDIVAGITASLSLPFFIRYIYTNKLKDGLHTFQTCAGFLMVLTVMVFPWFFLWGFIVYVLTRVYFKLRYNVVYPKPGA